jgi:DNA-binding Lrp family transcriptional regulator
MEDTSTKAFIMINTEVGKEQIALDELKELPETIEGYVTMGSYDIILKIKTDDVSSLRPLVTDKIRKVQGVLQTMTVICSE